GGGGWSRNGHLERLAAGLAGVVAELGDIAVRARGAALEHGPGLLRLRGAGRERLLVDELSVLEQAVGGGVGAPPQVGGEREGALRVRSAAAELGRAGGGVGDLHGDRLALGGAGGVHELAGVLVGAVGAPVD